MLEIRNHLAALDARHQIFMKESDDWARSLGYSLFSSSADGTYRNYICDDGTLSASLITRNSHGDVSAEVAGVGEWMFIQVNTGKLQFKHPDIMKFIHAVDDLLKQSHGSRTRIHAASILAQYKKDNDNG